MRKPKEPTYTLQEMLKLKGVTISIKETYSELEYLCEKRCLSSEAGALLMYDPMPKADISWVDKRLREHNMAFVQRKPGGYVTIVQLDDTKPLPPDYFEIGENLVMDLCCILEQEVRNK